jgi:hypothetical protein
MAELSEVVSEPIQKIEGDTQLFCRFQQDPERHERLKRFITDSFDAVYQALPSPLVKYSYDYTTGAKSPAPVAMGDIRFCTFEVYANFEAERIEVRLVPTVNFNGITLDLYQRPDLITQNVRNFLTALAEKILYDNARSEDHSFEHGNRIFSVSVDLYKNRALTSAGLYHRDVVSRDVGPAEHLSLEYFFASETTVALSPEIVRDTTSGNQVSTDELRALARANPIDRVLVTDKTVVCASNREVSHASPTVDAFSPSSTIAQQRGRFRIEASTPDRIRERFGEQGTRVIRATYGQRSFIRLLRHSRVFDAQPGASPFRHHAGGGHLSLQNIKLYTTYKIGLRISDIKEVRLNEKEISKMDKQLIDHLTIKKGGNTKRKTKRKSRRNKK